MTKSLTLDLLKDLLAEGRFLGEPTVEPVIPVVRTGDQIQFRQPGKNWLTQDQQKRRALRMDPASNADDEADGGNGSRTVLLGDWVAEFGFDPTDEDDMQDFVHYFEAYLMESEDEIRGVRYRGTYAVVSSSTTGTGRYRTIWSFRGNQALDKMTALAEPGQKLGVSEFGALTKRLRALANNDASAGRSQHWYQPAWGVKR